jgi:hypothetical protein
VEAQAVAMDRAMANHLADSSDPAVQAVLAFQSASDCHTLHRYETAFDLQADRVLRRLLSLRSRPEKICVSRGSSGKPETSYSSTR